jgi:lipase maturation factor 1
MNILNFTFFNNNDSSTVRFYFFKGLSVVYFISFLSLLSQADGLFSSNGIIPISSYITYLKEVLGDDCYLKVPTIFYVFSGDIFIKLCISLGLLFSMLLFFGRSTLLCLTSLLILYISIVNVGQSFLSFQWDVLLIECGFIAVLMAPVRIGRKVFNNSPAVFLTWALRVLLFRVMIASALVKWGSGDINWHNFTALDFHYWTQPLPHFISWYVDKLPSSIHKLSVILMFVIEAIIPFFIFLGRTPRRVAGYSFIALMVIIFCTGNYGYFNILIIVMCINLLNKSSDEDTPLFEYNLNWLSKNIIPILLILLGLSLELSRFTPINFIQKSLAPISKSIQPYHLVNGYGLFANMTTSRREIIIEGSMDGNHWESYEFKFKPGNLKRAPQWVQPHQPRLDWQMWFASLSTYDRQAWYMNFLFRLLQNEQSVTSLLLTNPFKKNAPKYIRSQLFEYSFNSYDNWKMTGEWWSRKYIGAYAPTVELH